MTRRNVEVEIIKVDEKSEKTLVDAIQALASRSAHCWSGSCDNFGFHAQSDGELNFDFTRCHDLYDKTSACFLAEEDMVWDSFKEDIKAVANSFPEFEFYFRMVSDGVNYSDELIYAHGSSYSCQENNAGLSPKQRWEFITSVNGKKEVKTECYGNVEVWSDREEAMASFLEAMMYSEGAERDRYTNVYIQLKCGYDYCTDRMEFL